MTDPTCPEPGCGKPMVLRTARRGRNAGGQFWGCSGYPHCKGLRNLGSGEGHESSSEEATDRERPSAARGRRRVEWRDGTLQRSGWIARYTLGGASLRSIDLPREVTRRYATCWIARESLDSYHPADPATRRVIALLRKILQRGAAPPVHPITEHELLREFGFGDRIQPSLLPGDLAPRLDPPERVPAGLNLVGWDADATVTSADLPYDSDEERWFHQQWVPQALGSRSARWFTPQASLDLLLVGSGSGTEGARRVDFLVTAPWCKPFIVEIDGDHGNLEDVDAARDVALRDAGYEVVRVPGSELGAEGPALAEIRRRCAEPDVAPLGPIVEALEAASQGHRLLLAMLDALASGFLAGDRWMVDVRDPTGWAVEVAVENLTLLCAAATLWGDEALAPKRIEFCGEGSTVFVRDGYGYKEIAASSEALPDVVIHLEPSRTSVEDLPVRDGRTPQIVVRSALLPVDVRDVAREGTERVPISTEGAGARQAIESMLQAIFAKRGFRDGQVEAILEVLAGRDSVVLLPTGAGKSLIYQLAGLCMPGRTLVIDPLVALIEDQVLGLQRNGIDRVAWITGDRMQQQGADALLGDIEAADALFVLISPERLQTARFRQSLAMLAVQTPINLAVVDEAHCVSEWGHQFRTAYLNLGSTIATTCRDRVGVRPPILALTGTASRAVLRDVLFELRIDQGPSTLIRPRSFDRPELHYRVEMSRPAEAAAVLRASVQNLPDAWNLTSAQFFAPRGYRTASGIVFCQVVNGRRGVIDVAKAIAPAVGAQPVVFSGKAPNGVPPRAWSATRADNASRFKSNETSVLVSTSAFGMGIDKPNIRWVVHFGLPGSIEAYYQEVGRAGRDGQQAECVLVYSEFDEARARLLLSEDLELEDARARCDAIKSWAERDDVTSALFFHFNSFPGIESEVEKLQGVVGRLEIGDTARVVELSFDRGGDDAQERALHRLVLLGVVREYLVDWGAKKFTVYVEPVEPQAVATVLLAYIERSQPGRVDALRSQLADEEIRKTEEAIRVCGRMLIEFVYDTIERSRRRSLREMWVAAKESLTDADLRRRVLDYLTEGDLAPLLERLSEQQHFDLAAWRDVYNSLVSVDDSREWRGTTARLLASYPDQPGLLIGRALAELADPEGDLEEFGSNLDAAIASAPRYEISAAELDELYRWLLGFAARRSARAFAAIYARLDVSGALEWLVDGTMPEPSGPYAGAPGAEVTRLRQSLGRSLEEIDEMLDLMRGRYL